jgi:Uma2 family endonuclease
MPRAAIQSQTPGWEFPLPPPSFVEKTGGMVILLPFADKTACEDLFQSACTTYPEHRVEMDASGKITIMSPVHSKGSRRNFLLLGRLFVWSEQNTLGLAFESSAGFTLPNGSKRSPDAAWIRMDRWDALSARQRRNFAHICPDFVVELRSETDRLKNLQKKMDEYIANGARLGWLIDPIKRQVHIYRPGKAVERLDEPQTLSGEDVLPGFVLDLTDILFDRT